MERKRDLIELLSHVLVEKDTSRVTGESNTWETMEEGSFSVTTLGTQP